ncbi:MAG TPA: hypothetical protein VGQ81_00675 [Acidobacteriota bacterium]|nr:hypothetical protein [Acidobacteriota bacterium]
MTKMRLRYFGLRIYNVFSGQLSAVAEPREAQSIIRNPQSKESAIRNPQSTIRNQENPQSEIRNPQSKEGSCLVLEL